MKINGSLVFDASGLSEIQNLRVQKVATVPTFGSSDVGRLVYNTGSEVIYFGTATEWVPIATGGNAAAIVADLDALKTSLGGLIKTDGTYDATQLTGTLGSSTSFTNVLQTLQTLIGTLRTDLGTEASDRGAEDVRLAGLITAEETRATTAENTLTSGLAAELIARADGDATNAVAIATAQTRAETAENVLGTAITAEETRATAAEGALGTRVTNEVADRTAADNVIASNLAQEILDRIAADSVINTALGQEVTRSTAAEIALQAAIDAQKAGLFWKNSARVATTGNIDLAAAASGYDGVTLVAGDRILVKGQTVPAENGVYVFAATGDALTRSTDTNTDANGFAYAVFVEEGTANADTGWTETSDDGSVLGTDAVSFTQFTGASGIGAGAGLSKSGNTINIGNADGSITITAEEISISSAVRKEITDNAAAVAAEVARAGVAETGLGTRITDETTARDAAITAEVTARNAAILVEKTRAEAAELVLTNGLAAELIARGDEDTRLAGLIAAEAIARGDADGIHDADILALQGKVNKLYFLYDGSVASTSHTVTHSLGQKFCNVTVVDDTDEVVIPQSIKFDSATQLTVTFNTSIACKVIVMGLAAV